MINRHHPASRLALAAALALLGATSAARADAVKSPHADQSNLASGKPVAFATPPDYPETSDADDAKQLTDGQATALDPTWYDKATVGWVGAKPVEFTLDLGAISPIRGVALRVAAGKSGVGWPSEVLVSVSDDGQQFAPVADLVKTSTNPGKGDGYRVLWLDAGKLETHGKFVRFQAKPADTGNGCFLFVDEVEVYKGDDAFLAKPLALTPAGDGSPRPALKNIAIGKTVTLNTPPNDDGTNDADDAKQLVDGKLSPAMPIWGDKLAVGWAAIDPTVFTVDLGADEPIRGVALHLAAGQAGVEWPANVQVHISVDGKQFTPLGDLMQMAEAKPPATGYAKFWLVGDKLETHGRFVKFVTSPINRGNGAYLFADEVEIYRGDDAWLAKPLGKMDAPERWEAPLATIAWRDLAASVPDAERPTRLRYVDRAEPATDAPLQSAKASDAGVTFSLVGEASKPRAMSWAGDLAKPISTANSRYAVLTFRANGLRRTYEARPIVTLQGFSEGSADGAAVLLEANAALNDGRSHTLVAKLPEGFALQQIRAAIVTEDDAASLTLERLELAAELPATFGLSTDAKAATVPGLQPADIAAALNGTIDSWNEQILTKHNVLRDGASSLSAGATMVSGVPFTVASSATNLALLPSSQPAEGTVKFLGHDVAKKFLEPASRDDALGIDVDVQAREAFLLLGVSAPPVQRRGGLPPAPLRLDDAECLAVELSYDRGPTETAFPYSLADEACIIPARALGAYAVAVDPSRRLKRVTLRSRQFGIDFALAALTFNTGARPIVPQLAAIDAPEVVRQNADPAAAPVAATRQGSRLTIANRWYEYGFNLANGFEIDRIVNRWSPSANIRASGGVRVRVGDAIYNGKSFRAEVVAVTKAGAELKLTSKREELPLEIGLTVTAGEGPELTFVAKATNRGAKPLAIEFSAPALEDVTIGGLAGTRIFFPQYRAVDTGDPIALRAPYGPEFASQFMTIYGRAAGVGLSIRTDNPDQRMADFAMRKDGGGVSGEVRFPQAYNTLAAGETRSFPAVTLVAHNGDWHAALTSYRDWLRTWYRPMKSQDKSFFQRAWEIACYRTSDVISWNDTRVPPFITKDRSKFETAATFEFEKQARGHLPDLVHFFNWTYNDAKKRNEYGVYGTPLAYEQVGGLESFRKGIAEIQQKWNVPLSLYTLIDRLRVSAIPDESLAKEMLATSWHQELDNDASSALRASGKVDGIIYPRIGNDRWIDFVVNDITTMQRDTGCQMVYVDVLPYFSHLVGDKGISPRDADMKVVKRLRAALPADVALWTEYAFTDVASQYADGALHYYFLELCEVFARRYNQSDRRGDVFAEMPINLNRYALTGYKTFDLPAYIEAGNKPGQIDAIFVNGEAIQEDTWRLHHSRMRDRIDRGYVLKHKYADCFDSASPVPQVPTTVTGIVANAFPGKNRTLWTLYNGRPKTFSGAVIRVPHKAGATYRDVWNDRAIEPVIEGNIATLAVTIEPQQPGCIVQERRAAN